MSDAADFDWEPNSEAVLRDQRSAYDRMRQHCPVAHSQLMHCTLFRHEDVKRVLLDHEAFSNAVSQHLSVPNGMDPPEHSQYRRVIEPYFSPQRMETFEPVCRTVAAGLVDSAIAMGEVDAMADVAVPFAVGVQCAFLGWPDTARPVLTRWTKQQYQATLAEDRAALSDLARDFERFVDELIESRLVTGADPLNDITAALMSETVWGRPLSHEEIASILRNWTVGEVGTISAAIGIVCEHLATHTDTQGALRADAGRLPAAIDEILRIHGPLVSSRRIATRPVEICGRRIDAGQRVTLNWVSANRDERVFESPDELRLDRDPDDNLLYGAGIHVCPGAPLARLELRVFAEELLARSAGIQLSLQNRPNRAVYPASGYCVLPLRLAPV